jgi:hypothetical protein
VVGPDDGIQLNCNPFKDVKEPECLTKWQLLKLDTMVRAYLTTVAQYKRLMPLQEKMMKAMEREIEDLDEAESWKTAGDEGEDDEDLDELDEGKDEDLGPDAPGDGAGGKTKF